MGAMSGLHWLVVAGIALLLFGPKRLPELAKGLGESIREFKKSMANLDEDELSRKNAKQLNKPTDDNSIG